MIEAMQHNRRKGPYPLSAHMTLMNALAAIDPTIATQIPQVLEGIRRYQSYEGNITPTTPLDVFYADGVFRILTCDAAVCGKKKPVVLVPSLINRYNIFDLTNEHSFVRFIAAQGYDVYVLDWGEFAQDQKAQTLDDVMLLRLNASMLKISDHHESAVHAVGYCMGGTLLAASAALLQECYASTTMIAAPWDFRAEGGGRLVEILESWKPSALPFIDNGKDLPLESIQSLFAAVDVRGTINKFSRFAEMDADSVQAKIFVAVEDWLNDGVALPAGIARECIKGWYGENTPACGQWQVDGAVIDPSTISCPVFGVASDQDKLVSFESAAALMDTMAGSRMLRLSCGHISMMAGRSCQNDVWQEIIKFIASID